MNGKDKTNVNAYLNLIENNDSLNPEERISKIQNLIDNGTIDIKDIESVNEILATQFTEKKDLADSINTATISSSENNDSEMPDMSLPENANKIGDGIPNYDLNTDTDAWNKRLTLKEPQLEPRISFNTTGLEFDLDETLSLEDKLNNLVVQKTTIDSYINSACSTLMNLDEKTKEYLKETYVDFEDLNDNLISVFSKNMFETLADIRDNVDKIIDGVETTDDDDTSSSKETSPIGTFTSSSSGGSHHTSNSSSNTKIDDIVADNSSNNTILASSLEKAIVGTITFLEIVPLYSEIGELSTDSVSLSGNYGLIGIAFKDDQYYYKVLDKDTNKFYYILVDDKIKIDTNIKEIAEIKEPAMMLSSTEIGTNNFVKLADRNSFYFVNEKVTNNDMTFLNVLDSTTSESYYIPLGDEVNLISLESIATNGNSDN